MDGTLKMIPESTSSRNRAAPSGANSGVTWIVRVPLVVSHVTTVPSAASASAACTQLHLARSKMYVLAQNSAGLLK